MATLITTAVADLTASADHTVDSTAQARAIRVTVYNADTVQHTFSLKIASKVIQRVVLQTLEDFTFGPFMVPSGTNVVVNNAEATTSTVPTFQVSGEY